VIIVASQPPRVVTRRFPPYVKGLSSPLYNILLWARSGGTVGRSFVSPLGVRHRTPLFLDPRLPSVIYSLDGVALTIL